MDYPVKFCPLCGSDNITTSIIDKEHIRLVCLNCGIITRIEMQPLKTHAISLVSFRDD